MPTRCSDGKTDCEQTGNEVKTLIITLACLVAALGGFLIGDYHGLWKRSQINRLEIIPIRFKAIDIITNQPVDNYYVRCRSLESSDLCPPVAGAAEPPGVKTVRIAGQRKFETGLLFNHDKGLVMDGPESIEIWVIHANYRIHNQETSYAELVSLGSKMKELILTPKVMPENM